MAKLKDLLGVNAANASPDPVGVIDIGSNSVRLVVYDGAVRAPTPLFNEKVLCGLGRSVASTGMLDEVAVERAIGALQRFRSIARILKVKNLRAIATAAVREASNGADFIRRGSKACGTAIDLLTGAEEAEFAAHGIMLGFAEPDGLVGDLGGGSLELVDVAGDRTRDAVTLPLGGLRLIDVTSGRFDKALAIADAEFSKVRWLSKGTGRPFYAVGGTWRALAKIHMEQHDYPLRVMHGYSIPAREAIAFCEGLTKAKRGTGLKTLGDMTRARREVLPYGALVLERLLRHVKPSEVVFSVYGIREGLIYSLLDKRERAKDPLLSFAEDFARVRSRSVKNAQELCDWTDPIFAHAGLDETNEERRLRHAACLLSDVGWRAHPDYRGEQSLNKVAHSGLAGVDHPGRIFLALSVYYRHVGAAEDGENGFSRRLRLAVSKRTLKRAKILGATLRAAHMISVGMPGVLDDTPVGYEGNKLVLKLPEKHGSLDDERLRRRFDALAELLGCTAEIRHVK